MLLSQTGTKMNNWEGGVRVNGFVSGGFLQTAAPKVDSTNTYRRTVQESISCKIDYQLVHPNTEYHLHLHTYMYTYVLHFVFPFPIDTDMVIRFTTK